MGALCMRVDYRTSMTIGPSSTSSSSVVGSSSSLAAATPHSEPISFHKGQLQQQQRSFRPRCDTSSSNRGVSDESEEHGGGVTSDDSQDRIFHADPVNTPQHQSSASSRSVLVQ